MSRETLTRETLDEALYQPTPPPAGDVLAELGFIDPQTGRPFQTPDWSPSQPVAARSDDYEVDETRQWGEAPREQSLTQAQPSAWDSPENPYRAEALRFRQSQGQQDPVKQAQAWYQGQEQQLVAGATQFRTQLLSQRDAQGRQMVPEELADLVTALGLRAALAETREKAFQYATYDVATEKAAQRIARDHSVGNVKVNARDLLDAGSAEGMAARARYIANQQAQQRETRFQARVMAGTDRRESGAPAGTALSQAYESMSPANKIRLGLLRGD